MSGQQIGTVVGGVIGVFLAPYTGGQSIYWGMAIGGLIGGAVDPQKIYGPHIGQGQQQQSTDGVPIAWVLGTGKIAGCLIAVGPRREVRVETDNGGKGGGPKTYSYEAHQDFAVLICESSSIRNSVIANVLMVEQDGKIVYDIRPQSNFATASSKWAANVDFLYGDENQMPHPTLEAIFGVGNTPAYRGSLIAVFKDFNLTPFGDRIPTFLFTVTGAGSNMAIRDFGPNFFAGGTPDSFQIVDGALENLPNDPSNNTYYRTPIQSSIIHLYAEFTQISLAGGDPMSICITNSANLPLFDFMCRAEDQIDPGHQRAYINYITESDRPTPQPWIPLVTLSAGVPYSFEAMINLQAGTFNYFLRSGSTILASGVANIRSRSGGPAYISFNRTGNINAASIVRYTYVTAAFDGSTMSLSDIVQRICSRGTIDLSKINSAALSTFPVNGYPIATQCSASDAMLPVLQAAFAFGTQIDDQILFKFYGEDALITINPGDAVINDASGGAIQRTRRNQATEFPQKIVGQYIDPDQNYNTVTAQAERLAQTVVASGTTTIQMPMAITATQAVQAVNKSLKVAYATLEGTTELSVPYALNGNNYIALCAGEPFIVDGKRWVTDEVDIGVGYLKLTARYDRQSAYQSNVQPIVGNTPTPPTSQYSGPTKLMVMNLPSLRTQDSYGVYMTAQGEDSSWRGCTVQVSYDGQQSFQNAMTITGRSVMGQIVSDLGDSAGDTITDVNVGTDDISSVTAEQIAAGANAYAIIDAANVAELRQAQNAALQSDGSYVLTDQLTGLKGTTFKLHNAGEAFTMLSNSVFFPIDISFKGQTLYFRAVGFGEVAESQPVVSLVYNPDTTVIIDGGKVT